MDGKTVPGSSVKLADNIYGWFHVEPIIKFLFFLIFSEHRKLTCYSMECCSMNNLRIHMFLGSDNSEPIINLIPKRKIEIFDQNENMGIENKFGFILKKQMKQTPQFAITGSIILIWNHRCIFIQKKYGMT